MGYVIVVVVVVVVLAASPQVSKVRQRKLRNVTIGEERAKEVRTKLLKYVKHQSRRRDQAIDLLDFWSQNEQLTEPDRHSIVNPLFDCGVLVKCRDQRRPSWVYWLRDDVLHLLPRHVALSEKGWDLIMRSHSLLHLGENNTFNINEVVGPGQINAAQAGAWSTAEVSGQAVNQPTVSAPIDNYRELVRLFAQALENETDALDANTRDVAKQILDRAQRELDDSGAGTDKIASSAHVIRGIAMSAAGAVAGRGAWDAVVAAVDHLLKLLS